MRLLASIVMAAAALAAPAFAQAPTPRELARVERILDRTPLVDGHNDLPWAIRDDHGGRLDGIDLTRDTRALSPPLHTDIPRLRRGGVGAQFWSVYVSAELKGLANTQAVLEQIDLTRRIIARHPETFEFADSAADIVRSHRAGRIASMFGVEGGESINNNLALLREFRRAGVLYMTLTHAQNTTGSTAPPPRPRMAASPPSAKRWSAR